MDHFIHHKQQQLDVLLCLRNSTEILLIRQALQDVVRCASITETHSMLAEHLGRDYQLLIIDWECLQNAGGSQINYNFMNWLKNEVPMAVFLLEDVTYSYSSYFMELGNHACVVKPYTLTLFQNALASVLRAAGKSEGELCSKT
ncbi:hypothetical protein [Oceanidesulfovibrio marinus]|uniref:Response regulatory domain-containing protein n=1 Tax=Oceanidesulfovibrio marinus TaxID=370038 RepID=A0ABX6NGG8_9BACT|nr:hypothetical protein [Oceanidesulfovibrio marinus]QJT09723.1 hypothetical protein E8L03_12595 [Oceanidesulfovibrio marinus]